MFELDRPLEETYFAWMGTVRDGAPLLPGPQPAGAHRVRSPARCGVRQPVPRPITSTPLCVRPTGDYGADLLRQHHERFDHTDGTLAPPAPRRESVTSPRALARAGHIVYA